MRDRGVRVLCEGMKRNSTLQKLVMSCEELLINVMICRVCIYILNKQPVM